MPFAHGLTPMISSAYGRVSGGHFNPAVSVGVLPRGAITAAEAAGYILSQIAGGRSRGAVVAGSCWVAWHWSRHSPRLTGPRSRGRAGDDHTGDRLCGRGECSRSPRTVVLSTRSPAAPAPSSRRVGLTLVFNILMVGPLTGAPSTLPGAGSR